MLSGFHSVVLTVMDFEPGVRDVSLLLGRDPSWLGSEPTTGMRSAFFSLANTLVEVRASGTEGTAGSTAAEDESLSEGLCGIRLGIDDASQAERALGMRNVAWRGVERDRVGASGDGAGWRESALVLDPVASRSIPVELVSAELARETFCETRPPDSPDTPGGTIEALDHVVIFSADLESTRDFYASDLGIRLALDRSFEARGVRLLFFRVGGVTIEIGGRLGTDPRPEAQDRFGGLAWRVGDVEAARERLGAEGFDVSEVRAGHKPGTRVCTVRAPVHGVPTLLIEPAV
jgi:catechol 2,3-dioxygenase-like lactoylglutathione lyase family enzyme